MHDVRITVMIFTTLVNTKTHTHRDSFRPAVLLSTSAATKKPSLLLKEVSFDVLF